MGAEYIHDIPGRLRVRCGALRKNEQKAIAVRATLAAIVGVKSVAVNPLTGSVTLHYDATTIDTPALLAALNTHGCFDGAASSGQALVRSGSNSNSNSSASASIATDPAAWLVKVAAGFLVEKAIERSLLALVAVVL